jgi:plastocyanin
VRRAAWPVGALGVPALLAAAAIALLSAGGAVAAECEWQPHKVRVVKQVKRHGKRVKVVRKRVRWSCVAVPAAPAATPPASPAPVVEAPAPVVTPPPVDATTNPHYLGAQAYEFGFTPTKPAFELQAGSDTVELINRGEDAHDLHLESLATHTTVLEVGATGSGGHSRATISLEAGEYRLYCSLANHAEEGMERTLLVTP